MKKKSLFTLLAVATLVLLSLLAVRTHRSSAQVALTRRFVIPNIVETNGEVNVQELNGTWMIPRLQNLTRREARSDFNLDTNLFLTHVGGIAGTPGANPAVVELFVFDSSTNEPLKSASSSDVCNPCFFQLAPHTGRQQRIVLHDLIVSAGGFRRNVELGYAVIVVTGDGAESVNVHSFVTNSASGAIELNVFGFAPVEIQAAS